MRLGIYSLNGKLRSLPKGQGGVCETKAGEATFYVKREQPSPPPHILANEYVAAELARLLRLPLPPSFVGRIPKTGELTFCSLNANMKGGSLPPIDAAAAVAAEPDLCTGVLVFDMWIVNGDRHGKNISYQAQREPHKLTIFDHSHALFFHGQYNSGNRGRLGIEGHLPGTNRHCLLDALDTDGHLDNWVQRVQGVSDGMIREILDEAEGLGLNPIFVREGGDFLKGRRDELDTLIRSRKVEFKGIKNWSLQWQ